MMMKKMNSQEKMNSQHSSAEVLGDGLDLWVLDLVKAMKSSLRETLAFLEEEVLLNLDPLVELLKKPESLKLARQVRQEEKRNLKRNLRTNKLIN